ncbi:MAG: sn-glycerol-3-phosphate ABC transporter ATP-binding protein UgpC [Alphaproteobacteria bacterium]
MADVQLRGVVKRFGNAVVIHGVDLDIKDREFCVFVGPSGCGKSTLLRLVAGLEDISDGDMMIDGQRVNDLPPAKRGIAMVFQSYALYPHMTTRENMEFGLQLAKEDKGKIRQLVDKAAAILQIEPLLDRKPKDMSGGQRQRVAIGRAIVRNPKVFLFDEPLSNLDAKLRVQMRLELAKLHRDLNATMIYVTHDQVEAMTMADKIVVLRSGYVEQVGSPLELYHRPQNLFVAGFIGSPSMNFINSSIVKVEGDAATVAMLGGATMPIKLAKPAAKGDRVTLGVRPEHLSLVPNNGAAISGRVIVTERLGGTTYHYVQCGVETLMVLSDGGSPIREGDDVTVYVDPSLVHIFNEDEQAIGLGTHYDA